MKDKIAQMSSDLALLRRETTRHTRELEDLNRRVIVSKKKR